MNQPINKEKCFCTVDEYCSLHQKPLEQCKKCLTMKRLYDGVICSRCYGEEAESTSTPHVQEGVEGILTELDIPWDTHTDGDAQIDTVTLNKEQLKYFVEKTRLLERERIIGVVDERIKKLAIDYSETGLSFFESRSDELQTLKESINK